MSKTILKLLVVTILFLSACELEKVDYAYEPEIQFKNIIVEDTVDLLNNKARLVTLHFYVIDGDGDIGPIVNCNFIGNCFTELYYKEGDTFLRDTTLFMDTVVCYGDTSMQNVTGWNTIPYVGDLGQDEALKADVYIENSYNTAPQNSYSEFFYLITIFDMAENRSNTVSTDTFRIGIE